jgi:hypothetical protein
MPKTTDRPKPRLPLRRAMWEPHSQVLFASSTQSGVPSVPSP